MDINGLIPTRNVLCKCPYIIYITGTINIVENFMIHNTIYNSKLYYQFIFRENYDLRLCQHLKQRTRFENKNEIDQAKVSSP